MSQVSTTFRSRDSLIGQLSRLAQTRGLRPYIYKPFLKYSLLLFCTPTSTPIPKYLPNKVPYRSQPTEYQTKPLIELPPTFILPAPLVHSGLLPYWLLHFPPRYCKLSGLKLPSVLSIIGLPVSHPIVLPNPDQLQDQLCTVYI